MKELLKKKITDTIKTWNEKDIYAISLYVYDDEDNPCMPTVTLGYNTEAAVKEQIPYAYDKQEARWNYAFWLQNNFFCFGIDDTADIVKQWILSEGFPYYEDYDDVPEDDYDELLERLGDITISFVQVLIEVVKEIHAQGLLTEKYGKELPILIHELEYYEEIAQQNIEANGEELVKDFVEFCTFSPF